MNPKKLNLQLKKEEIALVGYGSLLSRSSITKTLGYNYLGPFITCYLSGWRRSWDISMPNNAFYYLNERVRVYPKSIIYLNAHPDTKSRMNCALFVLNKDQLEKMHDREWIYNPVKITSNLIGVDVKGGDAIIYEGQRKYLVDNAKSPKEAAIRSSYLNNLENALGQVDNKFREEYSATTDPIPEHLIIHDILDPSRPNPWQSAGRKYRPF